MPVHHPAEAVTCVDLRNISARRDEVVAQLMDAATSIGFFQVSPTQVDRRTSTPLWEAEPKSFGRSIL